MLARVSNNDATQRSDLEIQFERGLAWFQKSAAILLGYAFIRFREPAGTKGHNSAEQRPVLTRLLESLRPGDIVLVTAISRLARDTAIYRHLRREIRKRGATLTAPFLALDIDAQPAILGDLFSSTNRLTGFSARFPIHRPRSFKGERKYVGRVSSWNEDALKPVATLFRKLWEIPLGPTPTVMRLNRRALLIWEQECEWMERVLTWTGRTPSNQDSSVTCGATCSGSLGC